MSKPNFIGNDPITQWPFESKSFIGNNSKFNVLFPIKITNPVATFNTNGTITTNNGVWGSQSLITFTYQWYRGLTAIVGEITNIYIYDWVLDPGQDIYCVVKATNSIGSVFASSNVWNILDLLSFNPAAWYDLNDTGTITLDTNKITQLNDKGLNGNHLFQSVSADQPIYNATDKALNATGSQTLLRTHSTDPITNMLSSEGKLSCFIVLKVFNPSLTNGDFPTPYRLLSTGSEPVARRPRISFLKATETIYMSNGTTTTVNASVLPYLGWRTVGFDSQTETGHRMFIDGTLVNSDGALIPNPSSTPLTLRLGSNVSTTFNGLHEIKELVHIVNDLSDSDRQKIEGILAWKHKQVNDLNPLSPYKLTPPVSA